MRHLFEQKSGRSWHVKGLQVIKLVSLTNTLLFHFISGKSAYFSKITFYAWPQSYNWFLLALVAKMCSTFTFKPRAVNIVSFIWSCKCLCYWTAPSFFFYPLFQTNIRRSWSCSCLLSIHLLLAFLAFSIMIQYLVVIIILSQLWVCVLSLVLVWLSFWKRL